MGEKCNMGGFDKASDNRLQVVLTLINSLEDDAFYAVVMSSLFYFLEDCVAPENWERAFDVFKKHLMSIRGKTNVELNAMADAGKTFDYIDFMRALSDTNNKTLSCTCKNGQFGEGERT